MTKSQLDIITRFIILGSVLLIAVSIFYYLVIYLPKKENQKALIELQKIESQKQAEQAEQDAKKKQSDMRAACIREAERNYTDDWNRECKGQGKLSQSCIELLDMSFDEYFEKYPVPEEKRINSMIEYYDKRDVCSCRLPLENADRIEKRKENAKDACYKEFGY